MALILVSSATAPLPGETPVTTLYAEASPPAGQGWMTTIPAGQTWALRAVLVAFATSATVATRTVVLEILLGGAAIVFSGAAATQPASTSYTYGWYRGLGASFQGPPVQTPLPEVNVSSGQSINGLAFNLEPGDAFTNILYYADVYT